MQKSELNITQLLIDYSNGNKSVLSEILPLVYTELKKISSMYLKKEYDTNTLQTTELVHEAYLKLFGSQNLTWGNRAHFFAIAARSMRQILIDHARSKKSDKRGSGEKKISLEDNEIVINDEQIIDLNDALNKFEQIQERSSKVVELKFFAGLTFDEIALTLDISESTVRRDWNFAKLWLMREMKN